MRVSTFHRHFRALTAMSPLQYQKQLRLQAARARMLAEGLDAANCEYSRFFGQPPMRDVRALRFPGAPALESVPAR